MYLTVSNKSTGSNENIVHFQWSYFILKIKNIESVICNIWMFSFDFSAIPNGKQ